MENIGFGGRSLSEDFERLVTAGADLLRNPAFAPGEIETVRQQIVSSFRTADQDTRHVAYREMRALCYAPAHPFHRLPEGRAETIRAIPGDALREFHARYFRPDLMTIAVVGDIRPPDALERIERAFGDWQAAGAPPAYGFPDAPQPAQAQRRVTRIAGKTQADVMIGFIGVRRTDPDFYALSLADLVLGRLGLRGRLGANVRDQHGLAYYVGSSLEAGVAAGPWAVFGGVNPRNLAQAIDGMLAEIRRLCAEPISAEELEEARDHLTGSLALRLETNDGVAGALNDIELFDLGYDFLERYRKIMSAITREQILDAVRRAMDPERYILSVAGSVDTV
jgi:zinc protease